MNNDLISRQAALDIFDDYNVAVENGQIEAYSRDRKRLCDLLPVQPDNQVHLCDSCSYTCPECPSVYTDMIFGNGTGNDNICACGKYLPSAQHEQRTGKWIPRDGRYYCGRCSGIAPKGIRWEFCPHCGAKMEGVNNESD